MKIRYIITLIAAALLLHLLWENAQAPLYAGYSSFSQHLPICSIGAIGDVVITLLVFGLMWLIKKDIPRTASDFLALAVIGFVIAVGIEWRALLFGRWSYTDAMPIIPWLNVGLTPIIQMTILLPLSFYLAKLFNKKIV